MRSSAEVTYPISNQGMLLCHLLLLLPHLLLLFSQMFVFIFNLVKEEREVREQGKEGM